MAVARSTRSTAGTAAVAVVAGVAAVLSDGVERAMFGAVGLLTAGLSAAMLYRPRAFFIDAGPEEPAPRRVGRPEELSPVPITVFEWVVFVVLAAIAAVGTAALAGGTPVAALMLAAFAAYCYLAGRLRLRRGYSHRDRFLLLFGELLAAASLVGLVLQLIVS